MPPNPCFKCKCEGICLTAGLLCRLAMEAWADDQEIPVCPFKQEDFYRGLEGVYA